MNNKLRQELFALVEYCKIYNHDIVDFAFGNEIECPDLQSKKLDIGIEVTSAVLEGEFEVIGKNCRVNDINRLTCFAHFIGSATDPNRLLYIVQEKTKKLNNHYKIFGTNTLFMRVSSNFTGTNYFSMCEAKEFVNILSNSLFYGELKFNPIILSQFGAENDSFYCFVINTNDYTIVEHQGRRVLSENEISVISCAIS